MSSSRRGNITGFEPQKFAAAAGKPAADPWARAEAWRYSGPFTRFNRFKGALPGLGWGAGLFGIYLAYEIVFMKDDHGYHSDKHSGDTH